MSALIAVYKREVSLFFRSTIAYAIAFGLLLFLGLIFSATVVSVVQDNQSGFFQPVPATPVITSQLGTLVFLMFIIGPLLTMRLLSEEAREGTLEVLMTLPMGDWAFVLAKFLAAWTFYSAVLLLTLVYVVLLNGMGVIDSGATFTAYLGAWLYGGAVIAVALIWSAVTEDQIVAAFLGAASVLVLFLADGLAVLAGERAGGALGDFVRELSLQAHYQQTMLQGILRAQDVLYFVSVIVTALFITTLIISTRRWRA